MALATNQPDTEGFWITPSKLSESLGSNNQLSMATVTSESITP